MLNTWGGLCAYGKEVKEEVKGYQRGENEYIILEDDELENVALDASSSSSQAMRFS
ncbi:MAG: hypothetical protein JWL86_4635 [Rhizobium sp.]|nr:hypothetical protein [Rhizobium sp.]